MMYEVIGTSKMIMDKGDPKASFPILWQCVCSLGSVYVLGKPADMGLVNMGGLRNILPKEKISPLANLLILPFENSTLVLTMKGTDMKRLFRLSLPCMEKEVSAFVWKSVRKANC